MGFTQIASVIAEAVARWGCDRERELDEIVALDAEVRASIARDIGRGRGA
jgi:1-deoxy-D-xylulose 5-phosphate reductoisomerase